MVKNTPYLNVYLNEFEKYLVCRYRQKDAQECNKNLYLFD